MYIHTFSIVLIQLRLDYFHRLYIYTFLNCTFYICFLSIKYSRLAAARQGRGVHRALDLAVGLNHETPVLPVITFMKLVCLASETCLGWMLMLISVRQLYTVAAFIL